MPFLKSLASRIINGNLAREHHFILWESVRTKKIEASGQYFWSCFNSNRSSRILIKSNSKFFLVLYYLQNLHCCNQYFCRGVSLHFLCCRLTGRSVLYQFKILLGSTNLENASQFVSDKKRRSVPLFHR